MGTHERPAGFVEGIRFWARYLTLEIWGPAQLEKEHDPVETLKEEHHEAQHDQHERQWQAELDARAPRPDDSA